MKELKELKESKLKNQNETKQLNDRVVFFEVDEVVSRLQKQRRYSKVIESRGPPCIHTYIYVYITR